MSLGNHLPKILKTKVSVRLGVKRNGSDIVSVYTSINNIFQQFNAFLTILKLLNGSYFYCYPWVILMWEGGGESGLNTNKVMARF